MLYIKGTQKNRKYKNRIYKMTKGQVTKFRKAKEKPKYVTAV